MTPETKTPPIGEGSLNSLPPTAPQAERELSPGELIAQWHAHSSDGPGAAHQLARKITPNADGSWTIAKEDIVLLVRMCSAFGKAGPPLVNMMRRHAALTGSGTLSGGQRPKGDGADQ